MDVSNVKNCFNAASAASAGNASQAQTYLTSIQGGRNFLQHGIYFNYRIDTPFPIRANRFTVLSNVEIVSELRSDWFVNRSSDTPVDTKFTYDAKESLNVPVFSLFSGKLSLAPAFEAIFYENKVSKNLYRSYSTSVSLNYSFDWHNGLNPMKAAGYQNPLPALPTLPSR